MSLQILWGSLVLGICSSINIFLMLGLIKILKGFRDKTKTEFPFFKLVGIVVLTFSVIILAHTIQVWVWAFFLIILGALDSYGDAVYFSLVTYTTVGYGDVTLNSDFRIFGAMASVTGLLGFGISTAFLVEILTRLLATHKE